MSPSSAESRPAGPEAGFTLVETLVAFAIAALLLAALFPALSGALRSAGRAGAEYRAVLWAESLIDMFGQTVPLQAGESTGTIDAATRWQARVRELATTPGTGGGPGLSAYEVTVDVMVDGADGSARASLTTVRLGIGRLAVGGS